MTSDSASAAPPPLRVDLAAIDAEIAALREREKHITKLWQSAPATHALPPPTSHGVLVAALGLVDRLRAALAPGAAP